MTLQKKTIFRMHKASILMIIAALIVVASIFMSPVFSQSTNPCISCHGGYYQYLDILEGNAANQLPSTIQVGGAATVTVVIENNVNTAVYSSLSGVSLSLTSQKGHFAVSAPTYNVGTLQKGTTIATWRITGVSAGQDSFVISANGQNPHKNLQFQDTYSPNPAITVTDSTPTPTPSPIQTQTPTPTTTSTISPTTPPTSIQTTTPIPSPTSTNPPVPTTTPDSSSTSTPIPIQTSSPTATEAYGSSQQPTPTSTPNTSNQSSNNTNQSPLKIWFTNPTEGATLTAGNKIIEWTTIGGSGNSSITLELSKAGSSGPWTTLAENLTSKNNFIWTVPNQQADYTIRATAIDSINPTQKATVTVATKIDSITQPEITAIISITIAILLLFAIFVTLIFKKRSIQNQTRKQEHAITKTLQISLYPFFKQKNPTKLW